MLSWPTRKQLSVNYYNQIATSLVIPYIFCFCNPDNVRVLQEGQGYWSSAVQNANETPACLAGKLVEKERAITALHGTVKTLQLQLAKQQLQDSAAPPSITVASTSSQVCPLCHHTAVKYCAAYTGNSSS